MPDMINLERLWLAIMEIKNRLSEMKIHCPQTVDSWCIQAPWSFIHFRWVSKSQLDFKRPLWIRPQVLLSPSPSILATLLSRSGNVPGRRTGKPVAPVRYRLRRLGIGYELSCGVRVYKGPKAFLCSESV